MTKYCTIAVALLAALTIAIPAQALVGPAPAGSAIADYDPATGQMTVSVNGVVNWFIQSASLALTGDPVMNLPQAGGAVSDNNEIVGETTGFIAQTYSSIDLGNIAATGLALSDLSISWNPTLGAPLQTGDVVMAGGGPTNLPPTASINGPFVVNIDLPGGPFGITLDATGSTDGGDGPDPLSYTWDLNDDGVFDDADTGNDPMLPIADVASQFGGKGLFPVAVRVFDGADAATAGTTVELIPEPTTLALGLMGLCGVLATRRRRVA